MTKYFCRKLFFILFVFFHIYNFHSFAQQYDFCGNKEDYYESILKEIWLRNREDIILELPSCFRNDRRLIIKAVSIDPSQFENASDILRGDQNFIKRLLKINPDILKFSSPEIRSNQEFMEYATYINRDSLKNAAWSLLDSKIFMRKMIDIDSMNYKFASDRLKDIPEFIELAFSDNGLLLEFATNKVRSDKNFVKIAIKSNPDAIVFADDKLKQDSELLKIIEADSKTNHKNCKEFLAENYFRNIDKKILGKEIDFKGKFFAENQIIDRNYLVKWKRIFDNKYRENAIEDFKLIAINEARNNSWQEDFKDYKDLSDKIERFFTNRHIAKNIIDNLTTTFLWKIKENPITLAFNLYLLGDSTDKDFGYNFSNITSLTAVVQKRNSSWEMSVIDVIFDKEIKVDISYKNGHKKYILWDLYVDSKDDNNPKIIFKVEDKFQEYLEVFEEKNNGKYLSVLKFPILD